VLKIDEPTAAVSVEILEKLLGKTNSDINSLMMAAKTQVAS